MLPAYSTAGRRLPIAMALLVSAAPGLAQSAPADQIVVTGSRLPAGVKAPTPLTVLGSQAIENRNPATIGEILQQIPSFGPIDSPNTAGVNSRGGGQINPDLRGLGATRTLVLINGRRHVPTSIDRVCRPEGGADACWSTASRSSPAARRRLMALTPSRASSTSCSRATSRAFAPPRRAAFLARMTGRSTGCRSPPAPASPAGAATSWPGSIM